MARSITARTLADKQPVAPGDLQQRRASITRTHTRGRNTVIEAQAPLANLFGYSSAMRGMSQGRATCSMEPSTYGPAPPEVLESFM